LSPKRDRGYALIRRGEAATLSLRRGSANVLDIATLEAMSAELSRIGEELLRSLVVTGEPHFCAGVAVEDHVPGKIDAMLAAMHGFLRALLAIRAVTIARVSGACLGGGAEIALACDLVFTAEDARIGFPEIGLACFPPAAAILLPEMIGGTVAAEWLLTGRRVSGREAARSGFAARAVPAARLESEVEEFVAELQTRSHAAVAETSALLRSRKKARFDGSIGDAEEAYRRLAATPDLAEAVAEFMARKRK